MTVCNVQEQVVHICKKLDLCWTLTDHLTEWSAQHVVRTSVLEMNEQSIDLFTEFEHDLMGNVFYCNKLQNWVS